MAGMTVDGVFEGTLDDSASYLGLTSGSAFMETIVVGNRRYVRGDQRFVQDFQDSGSFWRELVKAGLENLWHGYQELPSIHPEAWLVSIHDNPTGLSATVNESTQITYDVFGAADQIEGERDRLDGEGVYKYETQADGSTVAVYFSDDHELRRIEITGANSYGQETTSAITYLDWNDVDPIYTPPAEDVMN